jgi:hypothetical protein
MKIESDEVVERTKVEQKNRTKVEQKESNNKTSEQQ